MVVQAGYLTKGFAAGLHEYLDDLQTRMNQVGADTQPAVAPGPLTCRKIPAQTFWKV